MTITTQEIESQPQVWRQALGLVPDVAGLLARPGERVLALGCGTSAFVASSYAALREGAGLGVTDWAYASEPRAPRPYDAVLAISRSGDTTELVEALHAVPSGVRRIVVTGVADSPCAQLADDVLLFDFADEESVVQTRFPTSLLLAARAAFGEDVAQLPDQAAAALASPPEVLDGTAYDHFVYLGRGWTNGLALEAALKIREAAQAWAESYPLLDYRHGPMAVAHRGSLVWILGASDPELERQLTETTGATVVSGLAPDPLVELALAQQLAVSVATARGLNPDRPRYLTRAVVLG
jgi:fructoselysine-6-P-deglycase FrlB-like protein